LLIHQESILVAPIHLGAETQSLLVMNEKNVKTVARLLLGGALVYAGVSHLTFARKAFQAQVPDWVPLEKDDTVVYSGFAEIALGSSLILTPKEQEKTMGKVAASFFTAVFPGNISQYVNERSAFGLDTDRKRFVRLLFQPVLVYWALKSTGNL
jgi:uncharacterized membrane protein